MRSWSWGFCAALGCASGLMAAAIGGGLIYLYSLAWFARVVDVMLGAVR